jgi:hypothetical protein
MSHSTQILLATVAALFVIAYAWRRWGFFGALVVAVGISALAGAYVPTVRTTVVSAATAVRSLPDLVIHLAK